MDQPAVLFLLRAIHIGVGAFWIGGVLLVTFYLLPAAQATGIGGGQLLQEIMLRRRAPAHLIWAGWVTILAGVGLYMRNMATSHGAWARSPMGIGMSIGALAAFLGLMIQMIVAGPAARRMALAGAPDGAPLSDAERAGIARRLRIGTLTATLLLLISLVTMATARYY
ncbi:MAG TPA: hypothetical protein VF461_22400 [Gemmatimonadaceae bacterium]